VSVVIYRALWSAIVPVLSLTVLGLLGVSALLLAGRALSMSAVLPGASGLAVVLLGSLPAALAAALPVGGLAGAVAAGRGWAEGGDARALAVSGWPPTALLPPVLLLGGLLGAAEATLTHHLEPTGRAAVRQALHAAAGQLSLRPGQPLALGEVLLHASAASPAGYTDLFVASGDVVVQASDGAVESTGMLSLTDGGAVSLATEDRWRLSFSTAELALDIPRPRVELVERSDSSLRELIARTEADGRSAAYERLVLYKRTTLPLSLPLLTALGLPLGLSGTRPAAAAVAVTLGWWTLTRLCDQGVGALSAPWAAAIPLAALALLAAAVWGRLR
jgi:lipopolysaccharide export LptBFGC system permease protein LptF